MFIPTIQIKVCRVYLFILMLNPKKSRFIKYLLSCCLLQIKGHLPTCSCFYASFSDRKKVEGYDPQTRAFLLRPELGHFVRMFTISR